MYVVYKHRTIEIASGIVLLLLFQTETALSRGVCVDYLGGGIYKYSYIVLKMYFVSVPDLAIAS